MNWGKILKIAGKGALAFGTGGASLALPGVGAQSMLHDVVGDAGKGMAAMSDQAAQNRLIESQVAQKGPAADAEAMRNMMHASYVANGGYKAPATDPLAGLSSFGGAGVKMPSFGFGPSAATPEAQSFNQQMQDALLKRIKAGQPLTMSGVQPAGKMEKTGNWLGPVLNFGSQLAGMYMNRDKHDDGSGDSGGDYA